MFTISFKRIIGLGRLGTETIDRGRQRLWESGYLCSIVGFGQVLCQIVVGTDHPVMELATNFP